ncbi:MAG: addiction module toxin, HicA family [Deltaproteobacteria bacterium]|nr:MAG: addiction module toxin, HicA family [Deltaproteobacteria bacterium]
MAPWSSAEILKILSRDGWYVVSTRGSHVQLKHPNKRGRVTVPASKKDIPVGTVKSIERQAGTRFTKK